jgi:hypothetical protein
MWDYTSRVEFEHKDVIFELDQLFAYRPEITRYVALSGFRGHTRGFPTKGARILKGFDDWWARLKKGTTKQDKEGEEIRKSEFWSDTCQRVEFSYLQAQTRASGRRWFQRGEEVVANTLTSRS